MAAAKVDVRIPIRPSAPLEIATCRLRLVDVGLHLVASSLVDDFTSPNIPHVGLSGTRRRQLALDVVDAFADDDLDVTRTLAQDHDLEQLSAFRDTHLDFFRVHAAPKRDAASGRRAAWSTLPRCARRPARAA